MKECVRIIFILFMTVLVAHYSTLKLWIFVFTKLDKPTWMGILRT